MGTNNTMFVLFGLNVNILTIISFYIISYIQIAIVITTITYIKISIVAPPADGLNRPPPPPEPPDKPIDTVWL